MAETIGEALLEVMPDVGGFEDALLSAATGAAGSAADGMKDTFSDAFDDMTEVVTEEFGESLQETFEDSFELAGELLEDFGELWAETFEESEEQIIDLFDNITEGAEDAADDLGGAFDDASRDVRRTFDRLDSSIDRSLRDIGRSFDGVGDDLSDAFDDASRDVRSTFNQMESDARSTAGTLSNTFGDIELDFDVTGFDALTDAAESAFDAVSAAADGVADDISIGVSIGVDDALDALEELSDFDFDIDVDDFDLDFDGLIDAAEEAGDGISDGIEAGVSDALGFLEDLSDQDIDIGVEQFTEAADDIGAAFADAGADVDSTFDSMLVAEGVVGSALAGLGGAAAFGLGAVAITAGGAARSIDGVGDSVEELGEDLGGLDDVFSAAGLTEAFEEVRSTMSGTATEVEESFRKTFATATEVGGALESSMRTGSDGVKQTITDMVTEVNRQLHLIAGSGTASVVASAMVQTFQKASAQLVMDISFAVRDAQTALNELGRIEFDFQTVESSLDAALANAAAKLEVFQFQLQEALGTGLLELTEVSGQVGVAATSNFDEAAAAIKAAFTLAADEVIVQLHRIAGSGEAPIVAAAMRKAFEDALAGMTEDQVQAVGQFIDEWSRYFEVFKNELDRGRMHLENFQDFFQLGELDLSGWEGSLDEFGEYLESLAHQWDIEVGGHWAAFGAAAQEALDLLAANAPTAFREAFEPGIQSIVDTGAAVSGLFDELRDRFSDLDMASENLDDLSAAGQRSADALVEAMTSGIRRTEEEFAQVVPKVEAELARLTSPDPVELRIDAEQFAVELQATIAFIGNLEAAILDAVNRGTGHFETLARALDAAIDFGQVRGNVEAATEQVERGFEIFTDALQGHWEAMLMGARQEVSLMPGEVQPHFQAIADQIADLRDLGVGSAEQLRAAYDTWLAEGDTSALDELQATLSELAGRLTDEIRDGAEGGKQAISDLMASATEELSTLAAAAAIAGGDLAGSWEPALADFLESLEMAISRGRTHFEALGQGAAAEFSAGMAAGDLSEAQAAVQEWANDVSGHWDAVADAAREAGDGLPAHWQMIMDRLGTIFDWLADRGRELGVELSQAFGEVDADEVVDVADAMTAAFASETDATVDLVEAMVAKTIEALHRIAGSGEAPIVAAAMRQAFLDALSEIARAFETAIPDITSSLSGLSDDMPFEDLEAGIDSAASKLEQLSDIIGPTLTSTIGAYIDSLVDAGVATEAQADKMRDALGGLADELEQRLAVELQGLTDKLVNSLDLNVSDFDQFLEQAAQLGSSFSAKVGEALADDWDLDEVIAELASSTADAMGDFQNVAVHIMGETAARMADEFRNIDDLSDMAQLQPVVDAFNAGGDELLRVAGDIRGELERQLEGWGLAGTDVGDKLLAAFDAMVRGAEGLLGEIPPILEMGLDDMSVSAEQLARVTPMLFGKALEDLEAVLSQYGQAVDGTLSALGDNARQGIMPVTEAAEDAADAVEQSADRLGDALAGRALAGVREFAEETRETLADLREQFDEAIDAEGVGDAVEDLRSATGGAIQVMLDDLTMQFGELRDMVNEQLSGMGAEGTLAAEDLGRAFDTAADRISTAVDDALTEVRYQFEQGADTGDWESAAINIADAMGEATKDSEAAIDSLIEAVKRFPAELRDDVADAGGGFEDLNDLVGEVERQFDNLTVVDSIGEIQAQVDSLTDSTAAALSQLFNTVDQELQGRFDPLGEDASNTINLILEEFAGMSGGLRDRLDDLYDTAEDSFDRLPDTAKGAGEELLREIETAVDSSNEKLAELGRDLEGQPEIISADDVEDVTTVMASAFQEAFSIMRNAADGTSAAIVQFLHRIAGSGEAPIVAAAMQAAFVDATDAVRAQFSDAVDEIVANLSTLADRPLESAGQIATAFLDMGKDVKAVFADLQQQAATEMIDAGVVQEQGDQILAVFERVGGSVAQLFDQTATDVAQVGLRGQASVEQIEEAVRSVGAAMETAFGAGTDQLAAQLSDVQTQAAGTAGAMTEAFKISAREVAEGIAGMVALVIELLHRIAGSGEAPIVAAALEAAFAEAWAKIGTVTNVAVNGIIDDIRRLGEQRLELDEEGIEQQALAIGEKWRDLGRLIGEEMQAGGERATEALVTLGVSAEAAQESMEALTSTFGAALTANLADAEQQVYELINTLLDLGVDPLHAMKDLQRGVIATRETFEELRAEFTEALPEVSFDDAVTAQFQRAADDMKLIAFTAGAEIPELLIRAESFDAAENMLVDKFTGMMMALIDRIGELREASMELIDLAALDISITQVRGLFNRMQDDAYMAFDSMRGAWLESLRIDASAGAFISDSASIVVEAFDAAAMAAIGSVQGMKVEVLNIVRDTAQQLPAEELAEPFSHAGDAARDFGNSLEELGSLDAAFPDLRAEAANVQDSFGDLEQGVESASNNLESALLDIRDNIVDGSTDIEAAMDDVEQAFAGFGEDAGQQVADFAEEVRRALEGLVPEGSIDQFIADMERFEQSIGDLARGTGIDAALDWQNIVDDEGAEEAFANLEESLVEHLQRLVDTLQRGADAGVPGVVAGWDDAFNAMEELLANLTDSADSSFGGVRQAADTTSASLSQLNALAFFDLIDSLEMFLGRLQRVSVEGEGAESAIRRLAESVATDLGEVLSGSVDEMFAPLIAKAEELGTVDMTVLREQIDSLKASLQFVADLITNAAEVAREADGRFFPSENVLASIGELRRLLTETEEAIKATLAAAEDGSSFEAITSGMDEVAEAGTALVALSEQDMNIAEAILRPEDFETFKLEVLTALLEVREGIQGLLTGDLDSDAIVELINIVGTAADSVDQALFRIVGAWGEAAEAGDTQADRIVSAATGIALGVTEQLDSLNVAIGSIIQQVLRGTDEISAIRINLETGEATEQLVPWRDAVLGLLAGFADDVQEGMDRVNRQLRVEAEQQAFDELTGQLGELSSGLEDSASQADDTAGAFGRLRDALDEVLLLSTAGLDQMPGLAFLEGMQEAAQELPATLEELRGKLTEAMQMEFEADDFESMFEAITEAVGDALAEMDELFEHIKAVAAEAFEEGGLAAEDAASVATAVFGKMSNEVQGALIDIVSGMEDVAEALRTGGDSAAAFDRTMDRAASSMTRSMQDVARRAETAASAIADIEGAGEDAGNALEQAGDTGTTALDSIIDSAGDVGDSIRDSLTDGTEAAAEGLEELGRTADEQFQDIARNAGDAGTEGGATFSDNLSVELFGLEAEAAAAGQSISEALVDSIDADVDLSAVVASVESAGDDMGEALRDGISDGMEDAVGAAQDAAEDMNDALGGSGGGPPEDIKTAWGGMFEFINNNWKEVLAGFGAAGAAAEGFARTQQDTTQIIARSAIITGESEDAIRSMIDGITDWTFSSADAAEAMEVLIRRGVDTREEFEAILPAMDNFADATGRDVVSSTEEIADAARALGIPLAELEGELGSLTKLATETDVEFSQMARQLAMAGEDLGPLGLNFQDVNAAITIFTDRGENGRQAIRSFNDAVKSAEGDMGALYEELGVTADEFDAYRAAVEPAENLTEDMAKRMNDTATPMQRLQATVGNLAVRFGGLGEAAGIVAAPLAAVGPALLGITQGATILGKVVPALTKAKTLLAGAMKAVNLAFLANPFVLIGAAIIALGFIIWKFRDEILEALLSAWEWITETFGSLGEWFTDLWENIVAAAPAILASLVAFFSELPGRILGALSGLAGTVASFMARWNPVAVLLRLLRGGGDGSGQSITTWLGQLPARLLTALQAMPRLLLDFLSRYSPVAILLRLTLENWDTIRDWLRELPRNIVDSLTGMTTRVVEFIREYHPVAILWRQVQELWPTVQAWFAELPGRIWEWMNEMAARAILATVEMHDRVLEWIGNLVESAVEWVSGLPGRIMEFVTDMAGRFVTAALGLRDDVVAAFSEMVDGAVEFIGNLVSTMLELPGRIMTAVADIGMWLFDAGKDLIQGLIDGVGEMIGSAVDAVTGVGSRIAEGFRSFFGLSSPSRVMAEYGRDIIAGVPVGVEEGVGAAISALEAAARQLMDALTAIIIQGTLQLRMQFEDTLSQLPQIVAAAGRAAADNLNMFTREQRKWAGQLTREWQQLWRRLLPETLQFWRTVQRTSRDGQRTMLRDLSGWSRNFTREIQGTLRAVTRLFDGFARSGGTYTRRFSSEWLRGLAGWRRDSLREFTQTRDAIVRLFDRMVPTMERMGRNLIQGLIRGIRSQQAAATRAAQDVARAVTSGAGGQFQVRSPSRVFEEMGEQLIDGLIEGIRSGVRDAVRAMEDVAKQVSAASQFEPITLTLDFEDFDPRLFPSSTRFGGVGQQAQTAATVQSGPLIGGDVNIYSVDPKRSGRELMRTLKSKAYLGAPISPTRRN